MRTTLLSIGIGLAATGWFFSCTEGSPPTGTAAIELHWNVPSPQGSLRGILSGLVDSIRVTVSSEGKTLVQQSFSYEANQGTVIDIPAGARRVFLVEALGQNKVVYHGTTSNISITANQSVNVPVEMTSAYQTDVYPPAQVTDLAGETIGLTADLVWTATGNDAKAGQAAAYDLRWAETALTEANFASATKVLGLPAPAEAGTTEAFTVSGLASAKTYHFALKVLDAAGNSSPLSNEAIMTTGSVDIAAPAKVEDLQATVVTESWVTLQWTASGDDGTTGTVSQYKIRYSTSPINTANFESATPAAGPATPVVAGQTESVTITGLQNGQTYYLALKAADEVPNWSPLSKVITVVVQDQNPPMAVADLSGQDVTTNAVTLHWTATSDDGATEANSAYDVRYSTSAINADNFEALQTLVANPPAPQAPGSAEVLPVTGLTPDTDYYFAMKTVDEADNRSTLSNVVHVKTGQPDTTAPGNISNVNIESAAETSITITWNSPGDDGMTGTVDHYDIRKSEQPIDAGNFAQAKPVTGPAAPLPAGRTETLTITDLTMDATYYFGLKAFDEAGNSSALATISGHTPDTMAPAQVADLAVFNADTTSVSVLLKWTAPGDDGSTGTVTSYNIYHAENSIDPGNLPTPWSNPPAPLAAGSAQQVTIDSLTACKTYAFALTAVDNAGNESSLSNVVTEVTDIDPPSAISSLSAYNISTTFLSLRWNAPTDACLPNGVIGYDIRYSQSDIVDDAAFDAASQISFSGTPLPGGYEESKQVTGLTAGTLYYFAIKSFDQRGNMSVMSNVLSATTNP